MRNAFRHLTRRQRVNTLQLLTATVEKVIAKELWN